MVRREVRWGRTEREGGVEPQRLRLLSHLHAHLPRAHPSRRPIRARKPRLAVTGVHPWPDVLAERAACLQLVAVGRAAVAAAELGLLANLDRLPAALAVPASGAEAAVALGVAAALPAVLAWVGAAVVGGAGG